MVSRIGGSTGPQQAGAIVDSTLTEATLKVSEVQATPQQTEQPVEDKQLPIEKAQQMTDSMNKFLESANTQLRFKLHNELNEYYVTIVDAKTDEVVREIPSKKLMDMHAAMKEFVGLLIDRKI
ncbi:flagellar protein FlaG [Sporosarcina sp. OR05]|uniref:flagellar protein FlaG n=1 Tax=Sporosarcina sp. OR05 TaxID=2969819 RepID=UPI00352A5D2B